MSRRARRRAAALALVVAIVATAAIVLWPESGRPGTEAQAGAPASTATVERRTLRESEIVGGTYGYEPAVALAHRVAPAGSGSGGAGSGGSGSGSGGSGSGSGSSDGGSGDGSAAGAGNGGSGSGSGAGSGSDGGSGTGGGADNGGGSGSGGDGGLGNGGGSGAGSGNGGSGSGNDGGSGAGGGSGSDGGTGGSGTLTETAAAGQVVRRGGVLYRVDQRAIRLLYGTVPAWRTLGPGLRGRDVRQLQLNLSALGYGPVTVDGVFRRGTADAVRRWQRANGREQTGRVPLGEVVFADGALRVASVEATVGAPVGDGATVLKTTSTVRLVRVALDAAKQQLAKRGARVTVTLPNQRTVGGRIVEIGPVTASGGDGGGGGAGGGSGEAKAKLDVLIRLRSAKGTGRLDAAPVSVALTREIRRRVLAVPVTALVAGRGGDYALRVVRGATTTNVPVRVGMFSDGLAEVSGAGLREGDRVAVPDVE